MLCASQTASAKHRWFSLPDLITQGLDRTHSICVGGEKATTEDPPLYTVCSLYCSTKTNKFVSLQ